MEHIVSLHQSGCPFDRKKNFWLYETLSFYYCLYAFFFSLDIFAKTFFLPCFKKKKQTVEVVMVYVYEALALVFSSLILGSGVGKKTFYFFLIVLLLWFVAC